MLGIMPGMAWGQATSVVSAPPAVVDSAVKAVAILGDQVVEGHFEVAIQRMNPLWKDRMAKRMGGEAIIDQKARDMMATMEKQGIRMLSFKPQGTPQTYEVWPGKKIETINGQRVERLVYTKWLVLVPTLTHLRVTPPGHTKPVVIESTGYQVAVADKDKLQWSFIDGASATVSELRSLFISLPEDITLPAVGRRVIDNGAER